MEDIIGIALVVGLLYMVTFAIFTGYLASVKGYSRSMWSVLGLFFSILALLVVIGLPGKSAHNQVQAGAR